MRLRSPALAVVFALEAGALDAGALAAAPGPARPLSIHHVPITCLVAGAHPRIDACLSPAGDVARARIRFRSDRGPAWYAVEMAQEEGSCYAAILPQPLAGAGRVHYVIEGVSRASAESRSEEFLVRVGRDMAACAGQAAPSVPDATVRVTSLDAHASAVPAGFSASGIRGGPGAGRAGTARR